MFLADNQIIEAFLSIIETEHDIKYHAILSPNMKVVPIVGGLPDVFYQPPKELKAIVHDILGDVGISIDKPEKYCYNTSGQHRISLHEDGIHVYYSYIKEKNGD